MAGGVLLVSFLVLLFAVAVYITLGRNEVFSKLGRIGEEETQLDDSTVGYSSKDLDSEERLWDLDDSTVGYSSKDLDSEERRWDLFQSWMRKHEKSYESESATNQRFAIFKVNLRYIHSHNVQKPTPSYCLGLNNFADLTHEEFKTHHSGTKPPPRSENKWRKTENFKYGDVDPPASIDWRSKGAVTAIKIQGYCGESSSSEL
jgi:hypothetical protein